MDGDHSRELGGNRPTHEPARPQKLRLLGVLLGAPGPESLEVIVDFCEDESWLSSSVKELQAIGLERWQGEHTRLFVSAFPRTVCPPFASAYRQGQMNGAAAAAAMNFYAQVNLTNCTELPADYLGTLLECAAYLAENAVTLGGQNCIFWEHHLAPWVPQFAKDLRDNAGLQLYRELGTQLANLF